MEKKDAWEKASILGSIAGAILVPTILFLVGYLYNHRQAQAETNQLNFQNNSKLIEMCTSENKSLRIAGFDYALYLQEKGELEAEMFPILSATQANETDAEIAIQTAEKFEELKQSQSKDVQKMIRSLDSELPARIFFHVNNEADAKNAKSVQNWLEDQSDHFKNSLDVQSIQVKEYKVDTTELRYFNKTDRKEAAKLAALFDKHGIYVKVQDYSMKHKTAMTRPRHFELWFEKIPVP